MSRRADGPGAGRDAVPPDVPAPQVAPAALETRGLAPNIPAPAEGPHDAAAAGRHDAAAAPHEVGVRPHDAGTGPHDVASGWVLATGLVASASAALAPAGLAGGAVPAWSWFLWLAVAAGAVAGLGAVPGGLRAAARHLRLLLPVLLLLTAPVIVFAAAGRGGVVALAVVARALAASGAALATVSVLGAERVVGGLAALRVPGRIVEIVHAQLVALAAIVRQAAGMQRARCARRADARPWRSLAGAPVETLRGFGRLAAALLLRSMERAEALERARRALGAAGP
jgi:cobalt/nickel transport system permease protein